MISKTDVFKSYKLREKKNDKSKKENNLIRNQFVRMSNVFAIFFFMHFYSNFTNCNIITREDKVDVVLNPRLEMPFLRLLLMMDVSNPPLSSYTSIDTVAALAFVAMILLFALVLLVVVFLLLVAFLELLPLLPFFDENGAFWNTIAKPPGDGCSSAPCTARQRRNIVRPMINLKISTSIKPATPRVRWLVVRYRYFYIIVLVLLKPKRL